MVQQMKQCPTCHFTFADFQRVCTFDGAELVPYQKPQALMTVPQPETRRRGLRPLMSLTSLAVLFVFLSAVLVGYLKSPNSSIPTVVVEERDANLVNSRSGAGRIAKEVTAETRVTARATRVRSNPKRRVPASRVAPETNRAVTRAVVRTGNQSPNATIARHPEVRQTWRVYPPNATSPRQQEVPQTSRGKSPKVVAILKTTWKVLKKPFDF